jgi:DNA-binding XRE family transcriptional regulator
VLPTDRARPTSWSAQFQRLQRYYFSCIHCDTLTNMATISGKVIGKRLELLMKDVGMSQQQLADKAGTSRTRVNTYVKGHRIPDLQVLVRLADALGVRLRDLVDPD